MLAAMDLDRWLSQDGRPGEEVFARRAKTTQSTVNRLRNRKLRASLVLALRIEEATNGQVRAEDLPLTPRTRAALRSLRSRHAPPDPEPDAPTPAAASAA
jgi:DNA-binding transcriptional regulator YdaS (Cro superfamily)